MLRSMCLCALLCLTLAAGPAMAAQEGHTGYVPSNSGITDAQLEQLKGMSFSGARLTGVGTNSLMFEGLGDEAASVPPDPSVTQLLPDTALYSYVLDAKEAAKLGLFNLSAEYAGKKSVIVQEYAMFRDVDTDVGANTERQRYGVGLRMVVLVNEKLGKLGVSGLPSIAASVEVGKLEAEVSLEVLGISGKKINEAMPAVPAELNFTTLRSMYNAFDAIRDLIYDTDTTLTVKRIGVTRTAAPPSK